MDEEIFENFLAESQQLLNELKVLGESLKHVGTPNEEEAQRLSDFAQKLNRLVGGTSAMGFSMFSPLSRKTSLLAARCAEIKDQTIRVVIQNLNVVISVFSAYFYSLDSIQELELKVPDLEKRIDICMTAVGLDKPDIKTQEEIDELLAGFKS